MKAKIHQITFLFCIFLLAVSCEEDSGTQPLPEGRYPLEIAAVTLGVEGGDAQPWTRVAETADGRGSEFRPGDAIAVSMNGEVATYTYDDSQWTSEQPLYWQQAGQTAEVAAWHPATDAPIDFTHQDQGLAYLLKADAATATAGQPVSLNFRHQLAKVRVTLSGTQARQVDRVEVNNYTQCTHTQGGSVKPGAEGWIVMHRVDAATYEANIVPDEIDDSNFIRLNSTVLATNLTGILAPLEAGKMYTIDLTVGEPVTDITADNTTIGDDGYYRVSGNFNQTITVTGGNPTIYLENANISVGSGNAISITGDANATIHITGNNTVQNTSYTIDGAGIYVEAGSTVTIEGTNRNTDVLTAIAANDAAGIGGNSNGQDCGNIHIHNVTVVAKGDQSTALSPGIGSTGNNNCGQIIIDNATVHAYGQGISGTAVCPAIGPGFSSGLEYGNLPMVTIRNESEVHAHRGGGNADYIGYPYKYSVATGAASTVNLGQDGTCTSSTIYCYTGDTLDKTVVYDENGTGTEQSQ